MVLGNRVTKKSARALKAALEAEGYTGPTINWGNSVFRNDHGEVLNKPEAVLNAVNKSRALYMMADADVPTPLLTEFEAIEHLMAGNRIVARTSHHSQGRGFFLIRTLTGLQRARDGGASHYLQFIDNAREFRVHVINGKSVKISEKVFPPELDPTRRHRRNRRFGIVFEYPYEFNHKKTLRKLAKEAVAALDLDFGAVDILYSPELECVSRTYGTGHTSDYWVLEVNTAPCLTNENSDTLEVYTESFMSLYESEADLEDDHTHAE